MKSVTETLFQELGPGWTLMMSDPGGYPDAARFWARLDKQHGGDGLFYVGPTPELALANAVAKIGGVDHP